MSLLDARSNCRTRGAWTISPWRWRTPPICTTARPWSALLAHHQRVLEGMFSDANQRVQELPLLCDSDVQKLIEQFNRALVTGAPRQSFVQRFEALVERAPGAVACWDDRGAWSCLELARHANQVAHALAARGVARGDLVARVSGSERQAARDAARHLEGGRGVRAARPRVPEGLRPANPR